MRPHTDQDTSSFFPVDPDLRVLERISPTADEPTSHKPRFSLLAKRQSFYFSLVSLAALPLIGIIALAAFRGDLTLLLATAALGITSISLGWSILRSWEKKMRFSVQKLVRKKFESIQRASLAEESPEETELYRTEIKRLESVLEKVRIGYEQQLDRLHAGQAKSQDEVSKLHLDMDRKLEEMRVAYLEFEDLRGEYRRLEEQHLLFQKETEKNLNQRDALAAEYQKTIAEQRSIIEKKQRYIEKLEIKVRDLMFEIRSLLQIEPVAAETHPPIELNEQVLKEYYLPNHQGNSRPVPKDQLGQLQHYIQKVEELTGVDHLGYLGGKSPRFLDMSFECYAVDKRRLFDRFKDETTGILFIYDFENKKFIFTNQFIKTLLGWSVEKFAKEFPKLVPMGYSAWKQTVASLYETPSQPRQHLKLAMYHKTGETVALEGYFGAIQKGPFARHIMGLMAPL